MKVRVFAYWAVVGRQSGQPRRMVAWDAEIRAPAAARTGDVRRQGKGPVGCVASVWHELENRVSIALTQAEKRLSSLPKLVTHPDLISLKMQTKTAGMGALPGQFFRQHRAETNTNNYVQSRSG